jgi:hypothetical protein
MFAGEPGRTEERMAAINRDRKLCRERNVEIEDAFCRVGQETFGEDALIVARSTRHPAPGWSRWVQNTHRPSARGMSLSHQSTAAHDGMGRGPITS